MVHETDGRDVVVDLLDADGLSGEDLAEVDLPALEADAAAGGDGDGPVVERLSTMESFPLSKESSNRRVMYGMYHLSGEGAMREPGGTRCLGRVE